MKVIKTIIVEETKIGVGAIILLKCSSKQMIMLLNRKYTENKTCLIGDIDFQFSFDGVGLNVNDRLFRP